MSKYPVKNRNDGTSVELDNVNTIRLCRDLWERIIEKEKDPAHVVDLPYYDDKKQSVQDMGFNPSEIDFCCFCCAQLNKEHLSGVHCDTRCVLRELWGTINALGSNTTDAPCENSITSPYMAWKNGDMAAAQKIVDFCNAELRRMHVKMR